MLKLLHVMTSIMDTLVVMIAVVEEISIESNVRAVRYHNDL